MNDIAAGVSKVRIALGFHQSIAALIAGTVARLSERMGVQDVVLSGGVFQNRLLCELLDRRTGDAAWRGYHHMLVPPNDGGVSFGQAAVAAAILASGAESGNKE